MNDGTRTHDNRDHNPGLYQLSYAHHIIRTTIASELRLTFGTPGRTRTCYPRLRRPMLYPNELRALNLVGVERFELPTSCSQSRRATRLRYTPRTRDRRMNDTFDEFSRQAIIEKYFNIFYNYSNSSHLSYNSVKMLSCVASDLVTT